MPDTKDGVIEESGVPMGWRDAREVIRFLRKRGARISGVDDRVEGEWAAASSEGEGDMQHDGDNDKNVVWVSPST